MMSTGFSSVWRARVAIGVAMGASVPLLACAGDRAGDVEAANRRIAPVARVELAAATTGNKVARSGEQIYKAVCGACHDSGAAGAPKLGDAAAWAPRLGQGLEGLAKSATAGKNAMPAKGGSDADAVELARVVAYMANKSGAKFAEPK